MPDLRQQLLAAAVLLHLAMITATSLPLPSERLPQALKPRTQRIALAWGAPLLSLGWVDSRAELIEAFRLLNDTMASVRAEHLRPIMDWQRLSGTVQGWQMFSQIKPHGGRLQIHIRTDDGAWTPIFQDHDEGRWRATLLNQERVRAVRAAYAQRVGKRERQYKRLVRWLARHAAADFPQATAMRVRYQKVTIERPAVIREQGGLQLGEVFWEERVDLEALR